MPNSLFFNYCFTFVVYVHSFYIIVETDPDNPLISTLFLLIMSKIRNKSILVGY